jgi:hypothetical protein
MQKIPHCLRRKLCLWISEAADEGTAKSWAERIARVVEQRLALK